MEDGRLPIYDQVADHLLFDPLGKHHWREAPDVARHGDDDGDGVANHIDPDWNESADVLLGNEHPDIWTGVTRNDLPVTERPREDRGWPTPYRSS